MSNPVTGEGRYLDTKFHAQCSAKYNHHRRVRRQHLSFACQTPCEVASASGAGRHALCDVTRRSTAVVSKESSAFHSITVCRCTYLTFLTFGGPSTSPHSSTKMREIVLKSWHPDFRFPDLAQIEVHKINAFLDLRYPDLRTDQDR